MKGYDFLSFFRPFPQSIRLPLVPAVLQVPNLGETIQNVVERGVE